MMNRMQKLKYRIQKVDNWKNPSLFYILISNFLKSRSRSSIFYILSSVFFLSSCQAQKTTKPYYEDLSSLRPKVKLDETKSKDSGRVRKQVVDVRPRFTVNEKVNAILDSIDRFNLTRKFVDGYTIQIYSGQNRDDALNASKILAEHTTELKANVQYLQPKFKVTVGKYYTRLEAQKDLLRMKRIFTNAFLVPEKIMMK